MSNYDERPKSIEPILPRFSSAEENPTRQPRSRSVFWPIVLIALGVLLLLSNLGIFPISGWVVLWRFWPVALIALGIDVIFGRRTVGGAIAGGILILLLLGVAIGAAFFADQIPFLVGLTQPATMHYETVEHPLSDLKSAQVRIDWTSAPGYLSALDDSNNLIEASVAYRGELSFDVTAQGNHADVLLDSYQQGPGIFTFDDRDSRWDVKLNPRVSLDLKLDVGSGSCNFDLTGLDVKNLDLDGGSGSLRLTLPEDANFDGKIEGGSGSITLILPKAVGLRIELTDGSGSFNPDDRFRLVSGEFGDDGVWETENYDKADDKIVLEIDQGSGSISIQ